MVFDPALSKPEDRIRRALGDVSDSAPLMPEATYVAALALNDDDVKRATVQAVEWLIVQVAQDPNKVEVTGAVKVEWSERIAAWRTLANSLRTELGLPAVGVVGAMLVMGRFTRDAGITDEYGG